MHFTSILRISSLCAALLAGAIQVHAEELRIPIPGGALVLQVPQGWRSTKESAAVPTVSLSPASGNAFHVTVSALVAADGRMAQSSPEAMRGLVEASANEVKPQAVESSLPLQGFGSGDVQGQYFSATDRAPKPGEFKFMTQGALSVKGLPVAFTVLSNGDPKAAVEPTLRMLASARRQ